MLTAFADENAEPGSRSFSKSDEYRLSLLTFLDLTYPLFEFPETFRSALSWSIELEYLEKVITLGVFVILMPTNREVRMRYNRTINRTRVKEMHTPDLLTEYCEKEKIRVPAFVNDWNMEDLLIWFLSVSKITKWLTERLKKMEMEVYRIFSTAHAAAISYEDVAMLNAYLVRQPACQDETNQYFVRFGKENVCWRASRRAVEWIKVETLVKGGRSGNVHRDWHLIAYLLNHLKVTE